MADGASDVGIPPTMQQIIKDDYTFAKEAQDELKRWGFLEWGFDYNVVSILGCQSSGKSTLLNLLFGTHFPEMDSDIGRQQTTKGLWISRCEAFRALVMDVEGTDSKERGEQHVNFERKSALFSLALSEVLLINMWAADVGRYTASNYGLLKTVFDIHLQLFQQENAPKTLLVFVLRDHTTTPIERLADILRNDMDTIWQDLSKPDRFVNSRIADFFDLDFVSLPHKELQTDKFFSSVASFKDRFINKSAEDYFFQERYHKRIPADGFFTYAGGIWDTIINNKDVDIPTQKEMLANYRCDEIAEEVFGLFEDGAASVLVEADSPEIVADFGAKVHVYIRTSLAAYDKDASRYHKMVAGRKRETLLTRMVTHAKPSFDTQIDNIARVATAKFGEILADKLNVRTVDIGRDFALLASSALISAEAYFREIAKACIIPESDWTLEEGLQHFLDMAGKALEARKHKEVEDVVRKLKDSVKTRLGEAITQLISVADKDMWEKVRVAIAKTVAEVTAHVDEYARGFGMKTSERDALVHTLRDYSDAIVRRKFQESVGYLPIKMTKRFERAFKFNAHHVPRDWSVDEDISKAFIDARKKGEELLELFKSMRLTVDESQDASHEILSHAKLNELKDQYEQDIQPIFREALETQRRNAAGSGLPTWVFVVIFVLGFNEFVYLLSSPLLLILCILFGCGFYAIRALGLDGPVKNILRTVTREIVNNARPLAQTYVQQQPTARDRAASSSSKSKSD
eukprot:Opistho-2@34612